MLDKLCLICHPLKIKTLLLLCPTARGTRHGEQTSGFFKPYPGLPTVPGTSGQVIYWNLRLTKKIYMCAPGFRLKKVMYGRSELLLYSILIFILYFMYFGYFCNFFSIFHNILSKMFRVRAKT